jgi:predicted secreted protein
MALAGHPVLVYAKATNAAAVSGDEVDGINSVSYGPSLDLLDVTDFKDTTGTKLKLAGLKDGSISLSGDLEMTDAPQTLLRTAAGDGSSVWMTIHFNPSGAASAKGFQVECKVESFEISASVDGKVEFSASLQFNGAPVAV